MGTSTATAGSPTLLEILGMETTTSTRAATPGPTPEIAIFNPKAEVHHLGLDLDLDMEAGNTAGDDEYEDNFEIAGFGLDFAAEVMADFGGGGGAVLTFDETLADIVGQADRVAVTEPVAVMVPDVDANMIDADDVAPNVAAGIEALRIPSTKHRRKKRETPAAAKTAAYFTRREKNNLAAALNRAREKAAKVAAKEFHGRLASRNIALRAEVAALEAALEVLKARKAAAVDIAEIFAGLDAADFSLTPPALAM